MCHVCGGRGEFDNDHKYIKRMRELFNIPQEMEVKKKEPKKHGQEIEP